MNDTRVAWEPSGRPRLLDPLHPEVDLSIAHDADVCLTAVGTGPQGCDVQAVDSRTREDWLGLLGPTRTGYLDPLIAGGDTPDQAGTRMWTVVEASIKALGAPAPKAIRVLDRDGAAVLLEVDHATYGPWQVFTSLVCLEPGHDHVIAMGLPARAEPPRTTMDHVDHRRPRDNTQPSDLAGPNTVHSGLRLVTPRSEEPAPERYAGTFEPLANGRRRYRQAFRVMVKDVPKSLGSVYFPSYVAWMDSSREWAIREIIPEIESDLRNGNGRLISTSVSMHCLAAMRVGETLEAVLTTSASDWDQGPYSFDWEFHRGTANGPLVAYGSMQTVWVARDRSAVHRVAAAPPYLRDFMASLRSESAQPAIDAPSVRLGNLLARAEFGQSLASAHRDIEVTCEETDFQGHAHFVSYFRWQGIARDTLLRSLGITIADGSAVPMCLSSEMLYLRETLPFEHIRVVADVEAVYANGLDVRVSVLRRTEDGQTAEKVAVGTHRLALVEAGGTQQPVPHPLATGTLEALGLIPALARTA